MVAEVLEKHVKMLFTYPQVTTSLRPISMVIFASDLLL
jgi:hypothetical protein